MSSYKTTDSDENVLKASSSWITPEGRGEQCRSRSCHAQIDVRHTLGGDGRIVTLCADCRAIYLERGAA